MRRRLRNARIAAGMSQKQLAAALGTAHTEVSRAESGERAWPESRIKLALYEIAHYREVRDACAALARNMGWRHGVRVAAERTGKEARHA